MRHKNRSTDKLPARLVSVLCIARIIRKLLCLCGRDVNMKGDTIGPPLTFPVCVLLQKSGSLSDSDVLLEEEPEHIKSPLLKVGIFSVFF